VRVSVRTIKRKEIANSNPWALGYFDFPVDKDGIIYVRQSSLAQIQKNIHSYEMQTDKFVEHIRNIGCTGNITIIADDEGLSGTLDMHERPGMSRVMQLIKEEVIGWVAAVHVNRFFRDHWMINPDVFVKECYTHNVIVATLRMTFNFRDPNSYSQRIFRIEAEEAARHLEWMKLILGGGKRAASDKGYYDGRPLPWGYIVDRTDPERKRYIIYRPHAEIVFWLFRRFFELDGNFPALKREVEQMPFLFPPFEPGIDIKGFRRPKRKVQVPEYGYMPSEDGLKGILINPVYIGWWIPLDGGLIENNHEPIVDEGLFTFAHMRLSAFDLEGKRQKPARVTRNGVAEAILKKVTNAPNGRPIYAMNEKHNVLYRYSELTLLGKEYVFALPAPMIDSVFLDKFFEQLLGWKGCEDWEDKIENLRTNKEGRKQTIRNLIADATEKWNESMGIMKNPRIPKTEKMLIDLSNECKGLEKKIAKLEQDLISPEADHEEEEIMQYKIYTLLPDIIEKWTLLPFEQKLRIIGALVDRVVLNRPTPGWAVMEIKWKRNDWEGDMVYQRIESNGGTWTQEEMSLLYELWPSAQALEIVQALPTRTWGTLRVRAHLLNIRRPKGNLSKSAGYHTYLDVCFNDVLFAQEIGLIINDKNPQWCKRCPVDQSYARSHQP